MGIYSDYGVNPGSSKKASQLSAAITRQQYDDYQARFSPYLNKLTEKVSPEQIAADKSNWNKEFVSQAANAPEKAAGMTGRNMSRFGVASDSRANDSASKIAGIGAGSNAVSNMNNMNQSVDDRVMSLLGGQKLSEQR